MGVYIPRWGKRSLPRPKRYLVQESEDNIQLPWTRLKRGQRKQSNNTKVPCKLIKRRQILELGRAPWICLKIGQTVLAKEKGFKLLQKILTKVFANAPWFLFNKNLANFVSEEVDNNEAQWIRLKKNDLDLDDKKDTDDLKPILDTDEEKQQICG